MWIQSTVNSVVFQHTAARRRLGSVGKPTGAKKCFNTQPPEGGWLLEIDFFVVVGLVSTHSRPKAAGLLGFHFDHLERCFNTQPPEGGWLTILFILLVVAVSTHSRPKAAGEEIKTSCGILFQFQHTAARRRLALPLARSPTNTVFQHTAARRRLALVKAWPMSDRCFNTQPPEGGWNFIINNDRFYHSFNTQPPEGGWVDPTGQGSGAEFVSTHSRPKAAGDF